MQQPKLLYTTVHDLTSLVHISLPDFLVGDELQCLVHNAPFARPIPSVCPRQVGSTLKMVETGLWLVRVIGNPIGTQGYSGDPSPTPYDHPFSPNWGLTTPSQASAVF